MWMCVYLCSINAQINIVVNLKSTLAVLMESWLRSNLTNFVITQSSVNFKNYFNKNTRTLGAGQIFPLIFYFVLLN